MNIRFANGTAHRQFAATLRTRWVSRGPTVDGHHFVLAAVPPAALHRGRPASPVHLDVAGLAGASHRGQPPWRTPPARTPDRPRLSAALIVRTGPASLYAHAATKDELLELMLDQVLEGVPLPRPDPRRWRKQVKDLLRDQIRAMQAHPGIARVAWQIQVPIGPNALRHGEALLSLLRAGGLPVKEAAYAADALSLYTKAFAYEANAWSTVDMADTAARGKRMADYLETLPPDTFTFMAAAGELFTADTAGERLEFGLDTLLAGLSARQER